MAMPDPVIALKTYLAADADIAALAGAHVYGNELPETLDTEMPTFAVVIVHAGGGSMGLGFEDFGDFRFDVFAYGPTRYEANRLWRAVHRCLKQLSRVVRDETLLHWAKPAGGPNTLNDPDTKWPFTLSTWQVLLAEVPVA